MQDSWSSRVEFETRSVGLTTLWIPAGVLVVGLAALAAALREPTLRIPVGIMLLSFAAVVVSAVATEARARIVRDAPSSVVLLELRRYRLGRTRRLSVSALASIDLRVGPFRLTRSLHLADLYGRSLDVPLDIWGTQEQLLARLAAAGRQRGLLLAPDVERLLASAERDEPDAREFQHVVERLESGDKPEARALERARRWIGRPQRGIPARRGLVHSAALVTGWFALVLAIAVADRSSRVPDVDADAIARVAAGVGNPFVGTPGADLYLVPLDKAVVGDLRLAAGPLARRLGLHTHVAGVMRIDETVLDHGRDQLKAARLGDEVARAYHAVHGAAPAAVIGVTSLDGYLETVPEDRFAFAVHNRDERPPKYVRAFGIVSTARMHGDACGGDWREAPRWLRDWFAFREDPELTRTRLRKMVMRIVALEYYGLPETKSGAAITRSPIRSVCDIDRLEERFGVAPEVVSRIRDLHRARRFLVTRA